MQNIKRYVIKPLNCLVNIDVSTRLSSYFKPLFIVFSVCLYITNTKTFFINQVNQYFDIMLVIIYVFLIYLSHNNYDLWVTMSTTPCTCNMPNAWIGYTHIYTYIIRVHYSCFPYFEEWVLIYTHVYHSHSSYVGSSIHHSSFDDD